jgi:hypothetical protein
MRKLISALLCVVGLGVACHGFSGDAQRKAEKKKLAPDEIEALVKDLQSRDFATRDAASKGLLSANGAIASLRRSIGASGLDLEHRRRMESLLKEILRERFQRLLAE